jgi:hypothetical protein
MEAKCRALIVELGCATIRGSEEWRGLRIEEIAEDLTAEETKRIERGDGGGHAAHRW